MKAKLFTAVAACALLATAGASSAQTVFAASDLDVRAGPGPDYPVVGIIEIDSEATVLGCERESGWCEVDARGLIGWVNADYLDNAMAQADVYINEGPVDGVVSGAIPETVIDPGPPVITYIERNRYEPVYLESEIAVGGVLPDTVDLYEIPDYDYRYVYVNDRPVLVEPDTRRIVYIVR